LHFNHCARRRKQPIELLINIIIKDQHDAVAKKPHGHFAVTISESSDGSSVTAPLQCVNNTQNETKHQLVLLMEEIFVLGAISVKIYGN